MKKNILITLITCLTAHFFLNLYYAVRLSKVPVTRTVFNDPELGWNFSNDSARGFNDCGIREKLSCSEITVSSKKKILFLGNSVVYGKGV